MACLTWQLKRWVKRPSASSVATGFPSGQTFREIKVAAVLDNHRLALGEEGDHGKRQLQREEEQERFPIARGGAFGEEASRLGKESRLNLLHF